LRAKIYRSGVLIVLEVLAFPLLLIAASAMPKLKGNDKKNIQEIFENVGFGIKKKGGEAEYPKFKKLMKIHEGPEEIGLRYIYTIPKGFPVSRIVQEEKDMTLFSDGLNRPTLVEFRRITDDEKDPNYDPKKYLIISVFKKDIPSRFDYDSVPSYSEDWVIPLGKGLEGIIWVDFDNIPHMVVAGMTRFGKSVFLKVLTTYLIENHSKDVEFYIIDLKGGLEFGQYECLEQVKGVAGDFAHAFVMVQYIFNLMNDDMKMFKKLGLRNIKDSKIKRRRFVVVDEAASLAAEKFMNTKLDKLPEMEEFLELLPDGMEKGKLSDLLNYIQYMLSEIARKGGGLGYRLVYCTQYPTADTLPRQIKMNADSKISFRLPTGYASEVAIDSRGAEQLPSHIQGRAIYKSHDLQKMQVPYLSDQDMWKKLQRFQVPRIMEGEASNVIFEQEGTKTGGNPQHPGPSKVRNEGTNPNDSYVRFE
jgi:S-DNA-T family DNA segregation ATPase FtsK/SpoIIIE